GGFGMVWGFRCSVYFSLHSEVGGSAVFALSTSLPLLAVSFSAFSLAILVVCPSYWVMAFPPLRDWGGLVWNTPVVVGSWRLTLGSSGSTDLCRPLAGHLPCPEKWPFPLQLMHSRSLCLVHERPMPAGCVHPVAIHRWTSDLWVLKQYLYTAVLRQKVFM